MVACADGSLADDCVSRLAEHVVPGDLFVLNESRVLPARLAAEKDSGGRVELLLLERRADGTWLAMIKASHAPRPGRRLLLRDEEPVELEVLGREEDLFVLAERRGDLASSAGRCGRPPLPPYIRRDADADDVLRYQTTFARGSSSWSGPFSSVAAPTAGLHLTPRLMEEMKARGARFERIALGVGPGTFRPIESESVADHRMHEEALEVGEEAAQAVNETLARGARVTAVGTTSLRALEAASTPSGRVRALSARTGLFCMPGSRFRVVSRLMTNFHRPQSTLLALVAAFTGAERALEIHRQGVARGYRLFSYGDATLIERMR